jgi:hypothetical protein
LDATLGHVILHVQKVLLSGMLLDGQDGQTWKDYVHLPNVDGQIDPSLDVVHVGL